MAPFTLPSGFPVTDVAVHFEPESTEDLIDALGSVEWRLGGMDQTGVVTGNRI